MFSCQSLSYQCYVTWHQLSICDHFLLLAVPPPWRMTHVPLSFFPLSLDTQLIMTQRLTSSETFWNHRYSEKEINDWNKRNKRIPDSSSSNLQIDLFEELPQNWIGNLQMRSKDSGKKATTGRPTICSSSNIRIRKRELPRSGSSCATIGSTDCTTSPRSIATWRGESRAIPSCIRHINLRKEPLFFQFPEISKTISFSSFLFLIPSLVRCVSDVSAQNKRNRKKSP